MEELIFKPKLNSRISIPKKDSTTIKGFDKAVSRMRERPSSSNSNSHNNSKYQSSTQRDSSLLDSLIKRHLKLVEGTVLD